jgi:hypothetical protein
MAMIRDLLRCCEYFTSKVLTVAGLKLWGARMLEVKARMEVLFPFYCNTLVAHLLIHMADTFMRAGPMHACGMLTFERYHTLVHAMARGSRNILLSIAKNYDRLRASSRWRVSGEVRGKLLRRSGITKDTPTQPYYYDDWHNNDAWLCKGRGKDVILDDTMFEQLLVLWSDVHPVRTYIYVYIHVRVYIFYTCVVAATNLYVMDM